jgi:hypothetical protein
MKNKISKEKKDLFFRCQAYCRVCMNEGGCNLEKDVKKYGRPKIVNLVYNE